jgi:hypothetical protein
MTDLYLVASSGDASATTHTYSLSFLLRVAKSMKGTCATAQASGGRVIRITELRRDM